jgi:hypothetical protein
MRQKLAVGVDCTTRSAAGGWRAITGGLIAGLKDRGGQAGTGFIKLPFPTHRIASDESSNLGQLKRLLYNKCKSLVAHLRVLIIETLAASIIAGRAWLKAEGLAPSVINCGFSRGSRRCRSLIFLLFLLLLLIGLLTRAASERKG